MDGGAAEAKVPELSFDIKKRYWWLYVPFLSWVGLVFPLVLPPIPLGPIFITIAWDRREWMPHLKRGKAHLGENPPYGFPFGWFRNVFMNLTDLCTFGLTHLFITAAMVDRMERADADAEMPPKPSLVAWAFRWLLLGNIGFIAAYIACPGLLFRRALRRFECHLAEDAQRPAVGVAQSSEGHALPYSHVTDPAGLETGNGGRPVLLFAENAMAEARNTALKEFGKQLGGLVDHISEKDIAVRWCALDPSPGSPYATVVSHLESFGIAERGWTLFQGGEVVSHRAVSLEEPAGAKDAFAVAAREVIGVPSVARIPRARLANPDVLVDGVLDVKEASRGSRALLVTFTSSPQDEGQERLKLRNEVFPRIRRALDDQDVALYVANAHKRYGRTVHQQLSESLDKFKGKSMALFWRGQITHEQHIGFWGGWDSGVDAVLGWLGADASAGAQEGDTVEAPYHTVSSCREVPWVAGGKPAVLFTSKTTNAAQALSEFTDNVLPEVAPLAEAASVALCWCPVVDSERTAELEEQGIPQNGVTMMGPGASPTVSRSKLHRAIRSKWRSRPSRSCAKNVGSMGTGLSRSRGSLHGLPAGSPVRCWRVDPRAAAFRTGARGFPAVPDAPQGPRTPGRPEGIWRVSSVTGVGALSMRVRSDGEPEMVTEDQVSRSVDMKQMKPRRNTLRRSRHALRHPALRGGLRAWEWARREAGTGFDS